MGSETASAKVVPARYGPLNLATAEPRSNPKIPATNAATINAIAGCHFKLLVASAAAYAPTAINAP